MAPKPQTVEVIPSAKRLIRSLRDVGYDFRQAVADLVDNSIAAAASHVAIDMRFDGKESWIRIADNGKGMAGGAITEAMRFGTERDYEADELGKFGLGLKTASLSQCSDFTVASRASRNTRRIEVRHWSLGHVEDTNRWEVIDVPARSRRDCLIEPLQNSTGTVVLWENLDRVLGYKIPWGDRARKGFLRLAEELDLHLGMVFHRFISGEAHRRKKLRIAINGTQIEPWDPFARDEKVTIALPEREFEIHGDNGPGIVSYEPFVLPPQDKFSSLKAFNRCAGPGKWNYQQGYYIYRADRMIQSGGWSYMRTSDEHTKLARVALDFWPDLDSAFDLNVSKARVNLPADLKAQLQPQVDQLIKQARKAYSGKNSGTGEGKAGRRGSTSSGRRSSSTAAGSRGAGGDSKVYAEVREYIGNDLEQAARVAGERRALNRIRKALKSHSPETAQEIGW